MHQGHADEKESRVKPKVFTYNTLKYLQIKEKNVEKIKPKINGWSAWTHELGTFTRACTLTECTKSIENGAVNFDKKNSSTEKQYK